MEQQNSALQRADIMQAVMQCIVEAKELSKADQQSTAFLASQLTDLADDWLTSVYRWIQGGHCENSDLAANIKTKLGG